MKKKMGLHSNYPEKTSYHVATKTRPYPRVVVKRIKDVPMDPSTLTDVCMRAWWAEAQRIQKLCAPAGAEGFDWIGGSEDWPDWVSGDYIYATVVRGVNRPLTKHRVLSWLKNNGMRTMKKTAVRQNAKGRVVRRSDRVFFGMSAFRTGYLDRVSSDMVY